MMTNILGKLAGTELVVIVESTSMRKLDSIESVLRDELGKLEAGGVMLGLRIDGLDHIYSAGDLSEDDHSKSFYIYSISKSITAVAVMLLVERGLLSLDDKICERIDHYTLPEKATIRQLLYHTSGISDYFNDRTYQEAVHLNPSEPWSYDKLIEVGLSRTPLFEAGEGWAYSNPGYAILKELIELVSSEDYYVFVQREIFERIGMAHTQPFDRLDHGIDLIPGVDPQMVEDFRYVYDPGWISTGCFISTHKDVMKFYSCLFAGDLLDSGSLEEMMQTVVVPYPYPAPREPRCGLGLMSFANDPFGKNYGHGGGGPGYSNYATHYLDIKGASVSLSLVVNASLPQTPFRISEKVIETVYDAL